MQLRQLLHELTDRGYKRASVRVTFDESYINWSGGLNVRAEPGSLVPIDTLQSRVDRWRHKLWPWGRGQYSVVKRRDRREDSPLKDLPWLDENLEPPKLSYQSLMKTVWNSQSLINQLYGDVFMGWKHRTEEEIAWDEAVAWIAQKHAPEPPEESIVFDWQWPNPDVSQSPKPLGVGDLEEDWDYDDYDD